jgi:hypothetical protein
MERRTKPLRPALAPLTPHIPEPIIYNSAAELAQLRRENAAYKIICKKERQKFSRLSSAMLKYQGLLERQVATLGEVQSQVDALRHLYVEDLARNMVRQ